MRAACLVLVLWPLAASAQGFRKVDKEQEKLELIAKLSSDINKVDHSIQVTKELIKASPDAPYLADLYFRLAELHVERSRYVYARLMEQQVEGDSMLGADKALEVRIGKQLAIETYTKVLGEFPDYAHNDEVRFFKAHELRELGEWDQMMKEYKDLIAAFPRSDWAIEARLILGDHHFDKGELPQAELHYADILTLPESHLHDMARYKLGWIRINQEKFAEALKYFEQAVASGRKQKKGAIGDARKLNVKREALLAMAWPFTEVKKVQQAPEYFKDLADSKTLYVDALKRLANRYYVKTDYVASAVLYREVVALSADVEQNVDFVQRIHEAVRNMSPKDPRRYAAASSDVTAIVDTLATAESSWRFGAEEKAQLKTNFEQRARDLATRLDREARQAKDAETARVAAEAYRSYLSLFTGAKDRRAIEVNRAEALYLARDYVGAGEQYEAIARGLQESQEQGRLLYDAILAYHEALEADAAYRDKNPAKDGLLSRWELLRARQGLKQVGAYYVKTWPKSDNVASVKFNIAKMYYQEGDYERAADLFTTWVESYPSHKDVGIAGNLALDAVHKLDDLDRLGALGQRFAGNAAIASQKFKNEAAEIARAATARKVELTVVTVPEGDFSSRMIAEAEKHKGQKEGEEYLSVAFVKYRNENNIAGVFDFGTRLLGAYPSSPKLPDILSTMGTFAVRGADFERAAAYFEELWKRFPKHEAAVQVLSSAATIRLMLGDVATAAQDFRELRLVGDAAQRRHAHERLMEIYLDAQAWNDLERVAQTAAKDHPQWAAPVAHLGIAYAENGKDQLAVRELQRAGKLAAKSDADKEAQARALFTLGRVQQRQFEALQLKEDVSVEEVLGKKIELMQAVEKRYGEVIATGVGPWAIAALSEWARLYQGFSEFIGAAPVPVELSPEDKAAYRAQLGEQAQGFLRKAQETLQACAEKAEQLRVFTAHARACTTSSLEPVVLEARLSRSGNRLDDAEERELAAMRLELARTPESAELLKRLTRRAIQLGELHLARMAIAKVVEQNPKDGAAQNLLGVTLWSLGMPQQGFAALERAHKERAPGAAANLAALHAAYGYTKQAQRYLGEAGALTGFDLTAPDFHPTVRQLGNGATP